MSKVWVRAWNWCDENGSPIFAIDREMTVDEHLKIAGQYACQAISLTRPISREAIGAALYSDKDRNAYNDGREALGLVLDGLGGIKEV